MTCRLFVAYRSNGTDSDGKTAPTAFVFLQRTESNHLYCCKLKPPVAIPSISIWVSGHVSGGEEKAEHIGDANKQFNHNCLFVYSLRYLCISCETTIPNNNYELRNFYKMTPSVHYNEIIPIECGLHPLDIVATVRTINFLVEKF